MIITDEIVKKVQEYLSSGIFNGMIFYESTQQYGFNCSHIGCEDCVLYGASEDDDLLCYETEFVNYVYENHLFPEWFI